MTAAVGAATTGSSILDSYSLLPQPQMVVWVGYVKARRMMGSARLFCASGCSCRDVVLNAWHPSVHPQHALAALHVSQSAECQVGVQVLPQTRSGHHKFKVTGVMVSQFVVYPGPGSKHAPLHFLHGDDHEM